MRKPEGRCYERILLVTMSEASTANAGRELRDRLSHKQLFIRKALISVKVIGSFEG
jgi:hypothetical protein